MKLLCPNCEKEQLVEPYEKTVAVNVKGELIEVTPKLYKCLECSEVFQDPNNPQDELDMAYRIYRDKHNLLQPEELKRLRLSYGLGQLELSKLTGIGIATINRYENGSLQSTSHDTMLSLLKNPYAVKDLVDKNKDKLPKEKVQEIYQKIYELIEQDSLKNIEVSFQRYNANFSLKKLINAISLILKKAKEKNIQITKTKLNKLLFYIDFLSYKKYQTPLTAAVYAHLPYGPCLESYEVVLSSLEKENILSTIEHIEDDKAYEVIVPLKEPDSSVFSKQELSLIDEVLEKLLSKTAYELSEISHSEKAYTATKNGEIIDYEFAKYLKLGSDL
jgi:putative zinc finger/helix-turn-helix YgiT family protein